MYLEEVKVRSSGKVSVQGVMARDLAKVNGEEVMMMDSAN